jgi:hypothetical protein
MNDSSIESKESDDFGLPPRKKQATNGGMKPLITDKLNQSLWLVKLPHFVAEKWSNPALVKHHDVLGSFRVGLVQSENGKPPEKQLIVNLNTSSEDTNNHQHSVEDDVQTFVLKEVTTVGSSIAPSSSATTAAPEELMAFTSNEKLETFSIEGKITKSFALRPQQSSEYRNLVRERFLNKLATRRESTTVSYRDLQKIQSSQSHSSYTIESLSSVKQEMKRKSGKGTASATAAASSSSSTSAANDGSFDPNILKSKMFEAFEQCERQSFDSLLSYCYENCPGFSKESDLRALLDEYAKYNKKGIYKQLWELKSDFKDYASSSSSIVDKKSEDSFDHNNNRGGGNGSGNSNM